MKVFVPYLLTLLCAAGVTAALLPLLRRYAARLFMDRPGGPLKQHAHATPVVGGIAVFAGTWTALVALRLLTAFPSGTLRTLRGVLIGGTLIFFMGLVDDLKKPNGLPVSVKLLVQALATGALVYYGVFIHAFSSPWVSLPLTFLWIVGLTNAFNLLDIMDGLCVSQAVVCTLGLTLIALPGEYLYVNFAALALLGACLAFWPFNHAKHKVFLGDSGSNLLGFLVAALSIGTAYSEQTNWGFLAPLFLAAVPLFDTSFVVLARLVKGKNPLRGSNDHLALRLKNKGYSPRTIVLALIFCGVCFNLFAYWLTRCSGGVALGLFAVAAVLLGAATGWLLHLKAE